MPWGRAQSCPQWSWHMDNAAHVARSGPTRRWSLQWCWSSDFGHWDPPDHLFWSHTPPNILGEGGCWGHHSDVPAATTALPGQIHTGTSEANTARPLGGSPPPCSGPEAVGWLFNTYYWGRSYEVICERFSLASYTTDQLPYWLWLVGSHVSTGSLWARDFVPLPKAPHALQARHIFPITKSPEQMRNLKALRQSVCGFLPKGIPPKQGKILNIKIQWAAQEKAPRISISQT